MPFGVSLVSLSVLPAFPPCWLLLLSTSCLSPFSRGVRYCYTRWLVGQLPRRRMAAARNQPVVPDGAARRRVGEAFVARPPPTAVATPGAAWHQDAAGLCFVRRSWARVWAALSACCQTHRDASGRPLVIPICLPVAELLPIHSPLCHVTPPLRWDSRPPNPATIPPAPPLHSGCRIGMYACTAYCICQGYLRAACWVRAFPPPHPGARALRVCQHCSSRGGADVCKGLCT